MAKGKKASRNLVVLVIALGAALLLILATIIAANRKNINLGGKANYNSGLSSSDEIDTLENELNLLQIDSTLEEELELGELLD
jgi:hypothetical protein